MIQKGIEPFKIKNAFVLHFCWCPSCGKKDCFTCPPEHCSNCGRTLIELDLTPHIYMELPDFCTKEDIVEVSLGTIL